MKKNSFIYKTFILLIGGFITKILGMMIKIIMTRNLGEYKMGLYMTIVPTYNLFIVLSQMGFNISISKLISEKKRNNKKIMYSSLYISLLFNIFLLTFIYLIDNSICKMLHNNKLYYPILCMSLTLFFISLSCIIRSYFFGKEKFHVHVISNLVEQIMRLFLYSYILPKLCFLPDYKIICFIILTNIISEIVSIIILYFFLPSKINLFPIKPDIFIIKDILNISIINTMSKVIGTLSYFLEPIILTNLMIYKNININIITNEYGIITGYVYPLLLLPSFFSNAISQVLLPSISKTRNNSKIRNKVKKVLILSLSIGMFFTIIIHNYGKDLLSLIYNTDKGLNYLKISNIFFILLYIQPTLITILQGIDRSKDAFIGTILGIIIKNIFLIIFILLDFGFYSLILSTILNIIVTTLYDLFKVYKLVFLNNK